MRNREGIALRGTPTPPIIARCKLLKPQLEQWLALTYPDDYRFYNEDPSHTRFVQRAALLFNGRVVQ